MKYEVQLDSSMSPTQLIDTLKADGIKITGIKQLQYFYAVNLIVNGELIDSTDILASNEKEALENAYWIFKNGYDYDVIKVNDITMDMVQLERE